jgi:RHS repeat-associated protein
VTDVHGNVVRRHDYYPFGEEAAPTAAEDPLRFGGKERDVETGSDYLGARYYASRTGRFTTVDPVVNVPAGLTDPQRWNRYAYARNNPLVFIDPDGRDFYRVITPWEQELRRIAGAIRERVATALGANSTGPQHPLGVFGRNVVDSLLATVLPRDNQEYADAANAALLSGMAPMGGRFLGTTYSEAKTLVGAWGKGTFRTLSDTIAYHFEKHGGEVGAQNVLQYLRKASEFSRNLKGATKRFLEGGAIRYEKNGRYIIKDAEGNILSYGMMQ